MVDDQRAERELMREGRGRGGEQGGREGGNEQQAFHQGLRFGLQRFGLGSAWRRFRLPVPGAGFVQNATW
ncbi:hypothetical protein LNKW23_24290 [Paralimibaculum aggregatum]|uniref:Uncharacterized protein n=1 Tax=Paralimibaculum aggregatum TaxID=3036245 RepID=A0ABQ6LLB1_9RHOB|nr:hypothetical protein LNKW23_24290 [Limibaculum sp. NKW23]